MSKANARVSETFWEKLPSIDFEKQHPAKEQSPPSKFHQKILNSCCKNGALYSCFDHISSLHHLVSMPKVNKRLSKICL